MKLTYAQTIQKVKGRTLIWNPLLIIVKTDKNNNKAEPNPTGKGILYHESIGNNANKAIDTL